MYPIITQSINTVRNIKLIDIEYNLPIDLYIAMVIAVRIKRGNADIIIETKNFPTSTLNTSVSFVVTTTTDKVDTRIRGRLANIKIQCDDVDETWRFGTFRADVEPDGRR